METIFSELRGILLLIGVGAVIGVYLFSRRARELPSRGNSKTEVSTKDAGEVRVTSSQDAGVTVEAAGVSSVEGISSEDSGGISADSGERRLLVLHVRAMKGRKFSGDDILRIAEQSRLRRAAKDASGFFEYFDERQERSDPDGESQPLFYVANMFKPGFFDFRRMGSFSTAGLSLFAQLPRELPASEVFDRLHAQARLFAEGLQGSILDEHRNEATPETVRSIRETL